MLNPTNTDNVDAAAIPESLPLPQRLGASHYQQNIILKNIRTAEQGLRARLRSIQHDACSVLQIYNDLFPSPDDALPLYGNARAGSWYVPPVVNGTQTSTCSFKSADGHYGQWSSSLRRPNIHVLQTCAENGGVVLVDVTRRGKRWPDSFTKTVPIWCAVISIVAGLVECSCQKKHVSSGHAQICNECAPLHLHPDVPESEREHILGRLPTWVEEWQRSHLSLDKIVPALSKLRNSQKLLRPLWVDADSRTWMDGLPYKDLAFTPIICLSASKVTSPGERLFIEPKTSSETICGVSFPKCETGFPYVQGAGDDQESWSLSLTPALMWEHREALMEITDSSSRSSTASQVERDLEHEIKKVITASLLSQEMRDRPLHSAGYLQIWNTQVHLSYPQQESVHKLIKQAADTFDTIIVLGASRPAAQRNTELVPLAHCEEPDQSTGVWFSLKDRKGKVDHKYGFGRVLGPCLSLLRACCVARKKEALVCCTAKGGEWSAGLAIAWVAWHCGLQSSDVEGTGISHDSTQALSDYNVGEQRKIGINGVSKTEIQSTMLRFLSCFPQFELSRQTLKQLNRFFTSPNPSSSIPKA